jgi:AraC-like DNA-binding protein
MFPDLSPNFKLSFNLSNGLPKDYRGIILPGSIALTASGEPGTLILQEIRDESFHIQLSIFYFLRKFRLVFAANHSMLQVPFALKNKFLFRGNKISSLQIHQHEHALLHIPGIKLEGWFEKEKEYQLLDIHYPGETIEELTPSYPQLHGFFTKVKQLRPFVFTRPSGTPEKAREIVQQILSSPYEKNLQPYYFDKKIKEWLFLIFFRDFSGPSENMGLTREETKKIRDLEKMLAENLNQYFPLAELARKVQMNENKLEDAFKELFGKTVFGYHRDARLEEARRLIQEENLKVKEVYARVGYSSITGFITQFKKVFGYTPGSISD